MMAAEKAKSLDVGGLRFERQADGSARLTHPSGVVVVETRQYREARTASRVAELEAALKAETDYQAAFAALVVAEVEEP